MGTGTDSTVRSEHVVTVVESLQLHDSPKGHVLMTKSFVAQEVAERLNLSPATARKHIDRVIEEGLLVGVDTHSTLYADPYLPSPASVMLPTLYLKRRDTGHGYGHFYEVTEEALSRPGFGLGNTTFVATPAHVEAIVSHFAQAYRDEEELERRAAQAKKAEEEAAAEAVDPEAVELALRLRLLGVEVSFRPGRRGGVFLHIDGTPKTMQTLKDALKHGIKTAETISAGPETARVLANIAAIKEAAEEQIEPVEIEDTGTPNFTAPGPIVDTVDEIVGEACAASSTVTTNEGHNPMADRYLMAGILAELRRMNDRAERSES